MVFETKSVSELRKGSLQKLTKKPGPQLAKLRPDLGANGVQEKSTKLPRESRRHPGGDSAAPTGA